MGEPVKILDLAEKMIKLTGYQPYVDIDIEIIGLRPGEKLYEELLVDESKEHQKTANKKIYIEPSDDVNGIDKQMDEIMAVFETLDNEEIKHLVRRYVKTYVNSVKKHA
jgi:FlaA1/EpsC-like NDP-sugar epimerase